MFLTILNPTSNSSLWCYRDAQSYSLECHFTRNSKSH